MPKDVNAAVATIKTKRTIQFVDYRLDEDYQNIAKLKNFENSSSRYAIEHTMAVGIDI